MLALVVLANRDPLDPLSALIGYLALSLPLDIVGGQVLPRLWGRASVVSLSRWISLYFRGLCLHTTLLVGGLLGLSLAHRWAGAGAAAALYVLGALLLLHHQVRALGFLGATSQTSDGVHWLQTSDPRFSGGLSGLPGREQVVLPAHWKRSPLPDGWRFHQKRHLLLARTGARALGCGLGVAFTTAGLYLGLSATGGEVVRLACAMTLWSFAGLLILPSLSRPGVYYADALTADRGDPAAVITWLSWLEGLQEEDPTRSTWVERIFHPVPSWEGRRELGAARFFPWNAARTALWTSSLAGNLLSRAVHCNSGRPELWFWPPTD